MRQANLLLRRVFIVGDNSLFEECIKKLLAAGTDLSVTGAEYTNDIAILIAITQRQPDVIVLIESASVDSVHILELLFSTPSPVCPCIIIVRLRNNMIDIYQMPKEKMISKEIHERRQFLVTKRDDLISVVQGEFTHI